MGTVGCRPSLPGVLETPDPFFFSLQRNEKGGKSKNLRFLAGFGAEPQRSYFFSFGSSASRRPSPMKFRENIVRLMAAIGKNI